MRVGVTAFMDNGSGGRGESGRDIAAFGSVAERAASSAEYSEPCEFVTLRVYPAGLCAAL